MHRRLFLAGLAASAACVRARAAAPSTEERLTLANKRLAEIEAREGGRLGVFVRDTGTGATIEHRADERFPMCSTFKLLTAAAALKRVDEGAERLDRKIAYGPSDLLEYAPIAKAHVAEGGMTSPISAPRRSIGATTPPEIWSCNRSAAPQGLPSSRARSAIT